MSLIPRMNPWHVALFLQPSPDAQYAGGASSTTAPATDVLAQIFRFLLSSVPQWVQIAGIAIGGPVAIIAAWQAWKRRRALWAWFVARSLAFRIALLGGFAVAGMAAAGSGFYGYHYVMHENDFCQSCHIMDTAWNRFQVSAHKDLQCHECHRQPMYASLKELYWWVLERRMAVPVHDKVPTAICAECHGREATDSTRTNVLLTAGHVLHFKSDSSALKDLECVTCHGRDFHRFTPNNATCAQSGCHEKVRVALGAMSRQGFLHCTTCHQFRQRVGAEATAAQARTSLAPRALDCSACHNMTERILTFDLASDAHKGACGSCHNPHKQAEPRAAFESCGAAGCHASADTLTAFHRGLRGHTLDQCGACHQAHSWKVKGSDCLACHKTIFEDRPRVRPAGEAGGRRGEPDAEGGPYLASDAVVPLPGVDTTFVHSRHRDVPCLDCHTTSATHGALRFKSPEGCGACHHGAQQRATCTACHRTSALGAHSVAVAIRVTGREPVTRALPYTHERHAALDCTKCHGSDVRRSVAVTCASCHRDHHVAERDCIACHPTARTGHERSAHEGCATCHKEAVVAALPQSRPMCIACHPQQRDHYPRRDCAGCHAIPAHGPAVGREGARG